MLIPNTHGKLLDQELKAGFAISFNSAAYLQGHFMGTRVTDISLTL